MSIDWSEIERDHAHRPWPLPNRRWAMTMSWIDLLGAHWPVDPNLLEPTIPDGLTLDTYEGDAWLSLIPFEMDNVHPRGLTWSPLSMKFPEFNVRTYVTVDGDKPGVWFYSLDATSRLTVTGARTFFHLPYFNADMNIDVDGDTVDYQSRRTHRGEPNAEFRVTYRPTGPAEHADEGSLEYWLMERYCLYAEHRGALFRGDVQHRPWALRPAEADIELNTIFEWLKLDLPDEPALTNYVDGIHTLAWTLDRVQL